MRTHYANWVWQITLVPCCEWANGTDFATLQTIYHCEWALCCCEWTWRMSLCFADSLVDGPVLCGRLWMLECAFADGHCEWVLSWTLRTYIANEVHGFAHCERGRVFYRFANQCDLCDRGLRIMWVFYGIVLFFVHNLEYK